MLPVLHVNGSLNKSETTAGTITQSIISDCTMLEHDVPHQQTTHETHIDHTTLTRPLALSHRFEAYTQPTLWKTFRHTAYRTPQISTASNCRHAKKLPLRSLNSNTCQTWSRLAQC
jgi:hypothetical protein